MTNKRKIIILVALACIILLGIAMMVYPSFSAKYTQTHRSEVYADYITDVKEIDTSSLDEARAAAEAYNNKLFLNEIDRLDPMGNGYYDLLNISGNDIMAYVKIPKIDVTLPVFHGTSEAVLKLGAGHMPESSLPVGGNNTHSVITAHSGMASEPMFSDLELLEVGDTFQIDVLGEILTYQVYDIPDPVLPQHIDVISIQKDKDLCTLITCTPFGVNTHRLLIHAERIETPQETVTEPTAEPTQGATTESIWEDNYKKSVNTGITIIAISLFALIFLVIYIRYLHPRFKKNHEK